jgi:hypothetical protein
MCRSAARFHTHSEARQDDSEVKPKKATKAAIKEIGGCPLLCIAPVLCARDAGRVISKAGRVGPIYNLETGGRLQVLSSALYGVQPSSRPPVIKEVMT